MPPGLLADALSANLIDPTKPRSFDGLPHALRSLYG